MENFQQLQNSFHQKTRQKQPNDAEKICGVEIIFLKGQWYLV